MERRHITGHARKDAGICVGLQLGLGGGVLETRLERLIETLNQVEGEFMQGEVKKNSELRYGSIMGLIDDSRYVSWGQPHTPLGEPPRPP